MKPRCEIPKAAIARIARADEAHVVPGQGSGAPSRVDGGWPDRRDFALAFSASVGRSPGRNFWIIRRDDTHSSPGTVRSMVGREALGEQPLLHDHAGQPAVSELSAEREEYVKAPGGAWFAGLGGSKPETTPAPLMSSAIAHSPLPGAD
jgi:hypothetical protein